MESFYLLIFSFLLQPAHGQLDFGQPLDFQLTISKNYFRPGEDVTLTCKKTSNAVDNTRAESLVFSDSKDITWERNGRSIISTSKEGQKCQVRPYAQFGRPAVTQNELQAVTCTDDGTSVQLTIQNVTVSPTGDRWKCSKFPFLESNAVYLQNFVALTDVMLTMEDHFPNDLSTGILMTLACRAAPCNPPPTVRWQWTRDGKPLAIPSQKRTRSLVDGYGRSSLFSELSLPADPRYENATVMCQGSNSDGTWVTSNSVTLTIKRPPRILLTADPSNSVTEGTDVVLRCGAHGHPRPKVLWKKEGGFLPGGLHEADAPFVRLSPARMPDRGEYICTAFNGVNPNAVNSIYLKVDEPLRTLKISDKNRTAEMSDMTEAHGKAEQSQTSHSSESSSGGTIAAVVVAVLVVVAGLGLGAAWIMHKRRKQNFMSSPGSNASLFPQYPDNRSMTAPRPGLYVPRSSLRPTTHTPLSIDSVPQYLELPPAPGPPVGIMNKGYGISPKTKGLSIMDGRPLPASPTDESGKNWDSGYDEIRDVTPDRERVASSDGYEVPVLNAEEEEEECIYDVARPDSHNDEHLSRRRNVYMNDADSHSTQI